MSKMTNKNLIYKPNNRVVSSINEHRFEKIFECGLKKEDFYNLPIANEQHDTTNITTIYFGAKSKQWEDTLSLSALSAFRAGIRVRYYGEKAKDELFIIDDNEKCVLEFKTHKNDSRSNSKTRIGNDSNLTFGEITEYLSSITLNKVGKQHKRFEKLTPILRSLVDDFDITEITAIGAANYERLHYIFASFRATIDFNIKYFVSCKKNTDIIMVQQNTGDKTIVEIKSTCADENETVPIGQEFINRLGCEVRQTTRTKAKALKETLELYQPIFIEPELYEKSSYDWEITEREIKLDADKNPKDFISQCMESIKQNGLVAGKPRPNVNYQYIYNVGESGIVYMAKDLKGTKAVIKYKTHISHDRNTGALVRYEYVEPFSKETLDKATTFVGGNIDCDIQKSPFFCRDRLLCNIIFPHTRNVFEIYADHSYFINTGKKNDFFQVEIEYAGIVADQKTNIKPSKQFIAKINKDFAVLAKIIPEQFSNHGCKLHNSIRRKYDWVNKEFFLEKDNK